MDTVFIFPGQGSQYAGMAGDLPDGEPAVERVFEQAAEVSGLDVFELCLRGEQEVITRTDLCQLGVAAVSLAWLALLSERGVRPGAVAGHSLGEYCAAAAAGCMGTRQALELVWARGRAMREASLANPGGMVALVGVGPEAARELLAACLQDGEARIANHNASTQVVVAGSHAGLDRVKEEAARRGVRAMPLGVSGPFHTPAMRGAQAQVEEHMKGLEIKDPAVLFLSGYTAHVVSSGEEAARCLAEGMTSPVRWCELQAELVRRGAQSQAEVGPRQVISRMAKRDHPTLRILHASDLLQKGE
jgi:[acyl-carrier-protein] S-malonyltransferase